MNKLGKNWKRDKIKSDGNLILEKKQTLNFDCFCKTKCSNLLTEYQKIQVFNRYNALNSHSEQ
jgi:hypothetical protein